MIFDILGFCMEAMGAHGDPMGTHGDPWGPHGNPWEPMGPIGTHGSMDFPWIFHELSGRPEADKKCGGCGGGREPPPRRSERCDNESLPQRFVFFYFRNVVCEYVGLPDYYLSEMPTILRAGAREHFL